MRPPIDDVRISGQRALIPPAILIEEFPPTEASDAIVFAARQRIADVVCGDSDKLLVVVGPCSIHDTVSALEYAAKLKETVVEFDDELVVAMRCYFEKPRTVIGWKGFINDPDLDGTYKINKGLRKARKLLLDIAELGIPVGTEFLDTNLPQHISDLISWGAIGARTTESQVHRELASGMSMPMGFKNATDGDAQIAVDAVLAARSPHWFPSITKEGVAAIFESEGNDTCHLILRGGTKMGPNYGSEHVANAVSLLQSRGLRGRLMIDCSHGNSGKDHTNQSKVAQNVAEQIAAGSSSILGVMIESHITEGRQNYSPGQPLAYGQSITDGCISLDQTRPILDRLASSVGKRRVAA
ncbi:MAG: 3-deoxy-7-phosphoheptulonate synthase [Armatimonadota bacterium]|nr:3-deoxy-7-phosphoheptulonate synthase [Armatimonadota bacterium]